MVKYNKYLKEIGIRKDSYPFEDSSDKKDKAYKEDKEGFKPAEFYSLDYSLSLYIYSQLCYFRDHCLYGFPCEMTFEEWKSIVDKMIEAFKLIITDDDYDCLDKTMSKNREKKIKYGLRLFAKYFRHLWY